MEIVQRNKTKLYNYYFTILTSLTVQTEASLSYCQNLLGNEVAINDEMDQKQLHVVQTVRAIYFSSYIWTFPPPPPARSECNSQHGPVSAILIINIRIKFDFKNPWKMTANHRTAIRTARCSLVMAFSNGTRCLVKSVADSSITISTTLRVINGLLLKALWRCNI